VLADPRTPTGRRAGRLVAVLGALCALAGAVLVASALSPTELYEFARPRVIDLLGREPEFLTLEWTQGVAVRMRIIGAVLVVAGVALILVRGQLAVPVARRGEELRDSLRALRGDVAALARRFARDRTDLAVVAVLVLAAAAVRAAHLDDPMRYDEAFTYVEFGSRSLAVGLTAYPNQNNHLFHTLLVHLSSGVFGDRPWAIRLPVFTAGLALVPAAYVAGRTLYGRVAGLSAAALVAGATPLVEYSANARGYSLVALGFLLMIPIGRYAVVRCSLAGWLLLAVTITLSMYTIPLAAYPVAIVVLWLAAEAWLEGGELRGRRLRWLALTLVAAAWATLVLYGPVLMLGAAGLTNNKDFSADLPTVASDTWAEWSRDLRVFAALVGVAALAAVVWHRRVGRTHLPVVAAAVPVALVLTLLGRLVVYPRAWLFLLPLVLVTAGGGIQLIVRALAGRRRELVAGAAVALALGAVTVTSVAASGTIAEHNEGREVPAIAGDLERRLAPGDRVVSLTPFDYMLRYELTRRGIAPDPIVDELEPGRAGRVYVLVGRDQTLDQFAGREPFGRGQGEEFEPVPGLRDADDGSARVVRRFDTATLYEL
jgi:hypothetical protein